MKIYTITSSFDFREDPPLVFNIRCNKIEKVGKGTLVIDDSVVISFNEVIIDIVES